MPFPLSLCTRLSRFLVFTVLGIVTWLSWSHGAVAGELSQRLSTFPNFRHKPVVQQAEGDLVYPDWFAGTWQMTSTMEDMVAPLAPDLVTPGFEGNRQFLHQPVPSSIRFVEANVEKGRFLGRPVKTDTQIVSDRAYNGFNLAQAYLGDDAVVSVKVDPTNPNRQITVLNGGQQLISSVTGRATEASTDNDFLTEELFQQFFRGDRPSIYLNQVENITAYHYDASAVGEQPTITADQITAIYLSPQDPDYFKAGDSPVALYRYRLLFERE